MHVVHVHFFTNDSNRQYQFVTSTSQVVLSVTLAPEQSWSDAEPGIYLAIANLLQIDPTEIETLVQFINVRR